MTTKKVVSDLKKIIQIQEKIIKQLEKELKQVHNLWVEYGEKYQKYMFWYSQYKTEAENLHKELEFKKEDGGKNES
jgi:hypothetical protein